VNVILLFCLVYVLGDGASHANKCDFFVAKKIIMSKGGRFNLLSPFDYLNFGISSLLLARKATK